MANRSTGCPRWLTGSPRTRRVALAAAARSVAKSHPALATEAVTEPSNTTATARPGKQSRLTCDSQRHLGSGLDLLIIYAAIPLR